MFVVGCPMRRREWIVDAWFGHIEAACDLAGGIEPIYLTVAPADDPGAARLRELCRDRGRNVVVGKTDEEDAPDVREWNADRFEQMAALRNRLLLLVRDLEPELYLSIDSDILLHPEALCDLIESTERFDAVGGGAYMMVDRALPNVAWYIPGHWSLTRHEVEHVGVMPADVIMAVKLMTPPAYAVDYEAHPDWGEDIGWSFGCQRAGLKLGWDNRHYSKHVLEPRLLTEPDERLGW